MRKLRGKGKNAAGGGFFFKTTQAQRCEDPSMVESVSREQRSYGGPFAHSKGGKENGRVFLAPCLLPKADVDSASPPWGAGKQGKKKNTNHHQKPSEKQHKQGNFGSDHRRRNHQLRVRMETTVWPATA